MGYVLVIHDVKDYAAWRVEFHAAASRLKQAGELDYHVLVDAADGNRVVHIGQWKSLESAREFFQSPEIEEIRRRAGVSAPEFIYLESMERGIR